MNICAICGKEADCQHHLIFGFGMRKLADEDDLTIDICDDCHTMNPVANRIHGNPMAEALSKMLGQAIWERDFLAELMDETLVNEEYARDAFRKRYGRSYL